MHDIVCIQCISVVAMTSAYFCAINSNVKRSMYQGQCTKVNYLITVNAPDIAYYALWEYSVINDIGLPSTLSILVWIVFV